MLDIMDPLSSAMFFTKGYDHIRIFERGHIENVVVS